MNIVALGSLCKVQMGQAPDGGSYNEVGRGVPLIAGATDFGETYPQCRKFTDAPTKISECGDLLLCVRATVGDLNWSDRPYCLGRGVAALRPRNGDADIGYVAHWIRISHSALNKLARGSTFKQISRDDIAEFPIPLLSIEEQKRIAAILDKADAIRRKREQAIQLADEFLRSLFLDMFGDPVRNPKGWPRHSLRDLLSTIESGWSPECLDRAKLDSEWGVLKLSAVTNCVFEPGENKATVPGCLPRPKIEVRHGDVLFSRKNTYALVAASALAVEPPPRLMMSDLIFRLKIDETRRLLVPEYLWQVLIHPSQRKQIQRLAGGSAGSMPNISKARLLGALLAVPPYELQAEFALKLCKLRSLDRTSRALEEMATLNGSALSYQAFAGGLWPNALVGH